MFGIPDLSSTVMTHTRALAEEVDKFYGCATEALLKHPMLRAGAEAYLTLANAAWNLHPGVRLTRYLLSVRSRRPDFRVRGGREW